MKKITAILAFMIFSLLILASFSANIKAASAQDAGYTIQSVNHQIEVMYSGHVVIRDTIHVTGQLTDGFLIGLPYKYGSLHPQKRGLRRKPRLPHGVSACNYKTTADSTAQK